MVGLSEVEGLGEGVTAFGGPAGGEEDLTEDRLGFRAIWRLLDGSLCEG